MSKSTFALSIATLFFTLSACSSSGSDLPDSARLATAVAGTLEVVSKGLATPNPLQTPEKLGTEQPDDSATRPEPSTPTGVLRITYTSAGNVWLIEGADPPRQLSHTGHADRVILSSDGVFVAYVHNDFESGVFELRVVNADGSGDQVILDQADFDSLYPLKEAHHFLPSQMAFLSGTHRLLFNTQATFEGPGLLKNDDLLSFDVDAASLERLLAPGSGGDFYPSPDGTKLAIIQATSIGFSDSDGSNLNPELLSFPAVMTYSEYSYYPEPVWSPDSSHFAVVIPSQDPLAPDPTSTVWILSVDGKPPIQTALIDGQSFFTQAFGAPVIAPDLNKVAFMRPGTEQNDEHLVFADEDGGSEIVYTTGNLRWVGWSPDSSAFVYSVGPMDLQLGAIGEPPQPLGNGVQFRWVNSEDYLYLTGSRGDWALMIGSVGAAAEEIVRPVGDFIAYDFVP
ncbi:MAG: hypothetical protein E3J30_03465 [Anaerolineales bacterium]|nr:MAG: hypothetical protein E3J30_03465 [Anaerolineales bacterium]